MKTIVSSALIGILLAGEHVPAEPFAVNRRLGRGVNLGNALEAPREGEWGMTLEAEHFRLIADAGFHSVRIPIKWSAHAEAQPPYAIDGGFFDRIDWALDRALENNLAAVVNIHHYDEIMQDPARHKERFLALWRQIAARYRDRPPEVVFEVLNEPNSKLDPETWNGYAVAAVGVIRETNPERAVILMPAEWGGIGALNRLGLPDDANIIASVHYYLPFQFTHQGASWVSGSDAWLGTTWNGTDSEKLAIEQHFANVKTWAGQKGVPVYVGEFGAYGAADMQSRADWTGYVARTMEKNGFSWAYWEFGAGFGVYDRAAGQWRQPLRQALLDAPLGPVQFPPAMGPQRDGWLRLPHGVFVSEQAGSFEAPVARNLLGRKLPSFPSR